MRYAYAGRTGATDLGPRLVASVWELPAADEQPPPELTSLFPFEQMADMGEASLEVLPLGINLPFESVEEPRILRVFRGRCRPGEREAYIEAVREVTHHSVASGRGPLALFLGADEADGLVTVSVWTTWENIEAATGGNLRQQIATGAADALVSGDAHHYEIVPGSLVGSQRGGASG